MALQPSNLPVFGQIRCNTTVVNLVCRAGPVISLDHSRKAVGYFSRIALKDAKHESQECRKTNGKEFRDSDEGAIS